MAEIAENSSIMCGKIAEIWLHGSSEAKIAESNSMACGQIAETAEQ